MFGFDITVPARGRLVIVLEREAGPLRAVLDQPSALRRVRSEAGTAWRYLRTVARSAARLMALASLPTPADPTPAADASLEQAGELKIGQVGIANLRARLANLYGPMASLTLSQLLPAGVRAEMRLPCAP